MNKLKPEKKKKRKQKESKLNKMQGKNGRKKGVFIQRNNRKKKMNWKISHQYEGMSNEEEV